MCCFYYNKAGELANKGAFNWNAPLFLPSWPVAALGSHDDQRTAQSISLASGLTCITARGLHEAGPWLAETRLSIWPLGVVREGLLNYLKYPLWHSLDFLIRDIPTPTIYDLVLMQFIFLAWDARVRSILSLQRTG